jgi:CRP-like cAMP-binding protein
MNKLLASIPADDMQRISPHLVAVSLPLRQVLYKEDDTIRDVYFLSSGACSLIKTMNDGAAAEIATIGNEGVIGSSVYFGENRSISQAIIQLARAEGFKMPAESFITEMERHGAFYNKVLRYSQALMSQTMQTTVCNGLHSAEQRCCRWLLMTRDRVESDDLKLTHDLLAHMLGVRRPTVTIIIRDLQNKGLVEHHRGMLRIRDRHRLEGVSCECYATVNASFSRLLPEMARQGVIGPWSQPDRMKGTLAVLAIVE